MPYKKKTAKRSKAVISENVRTFLLTGERAKGDAEIFRLAGSWERLGNVWAAVKKEIIRDFIKQHPCTRPWVFWHFDIKDLRRRVGGIGDLMHEIEFYEPLRQCCHGIPMGWVAGWQVEYYNGRFKDIHGNVIDSGFKEGDFLKVAYDEGNPPLYESEASFLKRHKLLSETEQRYLKQHPELLEPEKVIFEND